MNKYFVQRSGSSLISEETFEITVEKVRCSV